MPPLASFGMRVPATTRLDSRVEYSVRARVGEKPFVSQGRTCQPIIETHRCRNMGVAPQTLVFRGGVS